MLEIKGIDYGVTYQGKQGQNCDQGVFENPQGIYVRVVRLDVFEGEGKGLVSGGYLFWILESIVCGRGAGSGTRGLGRPLPSAFPVGGASRSTGLTGS
jgi:hypothetical protein